MRISLFILLLMIFSSPIYGQVTEGLVGYFPFTNGSFADSSGYQDCVFDSNGDSILYLIEDRFGHIDQALNFQGAILNAGEISRDVTTEITVSLWMKTTESPEDVKFLISKYYCIEPPLGYLLAFLGDSVTFDGRDNSSSGYMRSGWSETAINDGVWHHILGVVRSQGVWELWIDGRKEGSNLHSPIIELNHYFCNLGIAGRPNGVDEIRTYKGALDDIRLYNRALDSLEIDSLFNEVVTVVGSNEHIANSLILKSYPNPFSTTLTIEYVLNKPETVRTTFYNQIGKQVDVIEGNQNQGLNKTIWTPKDLPNGIYYFKFQADEMVEMGKIVLWKN